MLFFSREGLPVFFAHFTSFCGIWLPLCGSKSVLVAEVFVCSCNPRPKNEIYEYVAQWVASVNELVSVWLFVCRKICGCLPPYLHARTRRAWWLETKMRKCECKSIFIEKHTSTENIALLDGKGRWAQSKYAKYEYAKKHSNSTTKIIMLAFTHFIHVVPCQAKPAKWNTNGHVTMLCSKNGSNPNCTHFRITKDNIKLIIKCSWVSA